MGIPLMDIRAQYAPVRAGLDAAISVILDTGTLILGPGVAHGGAAHGTSHSLTTGWPR